MKIFAGSAHYNSEIAPVVTIGNFDGVHRGHQYLLSILLEEAHKRNAPSCVFTFEPSPRTLLSPNRVPRIAPWTQKIKLLESFGIEHIILERFSRPFAQHPARWFVQEIIQKRLRAQAMVVGYDFRFGRARSGTIETLRQLAPEVEICQPRALSEKEITISSSEIRKCVSAGKMKLASALLGRDYSLEGVIVSGEKRGRTLGYPTANIQTDYDLIPDIGVYAIRARIDYGNWIDGIANLGYNPTFQGQKFKIEVHLFNFSQDIYGSDIEVTFIERLRNEKKFHDVNALIGQLKKDIIHTKKILSGQDK